MPDIDKIIERLLGDRRIREGAAFTKRSYSDQPLIEKGSDLKERMERRAAERAQRHEQEARSRRTRAQDTVERRPPESPSRPTATVHEARRTSRQGQPVSGQRIPPQRQQPTTSPLTTPRLRDFGDWIRSLDIEGQVSRTLESIGLDSLPEPIREMRRLESGGMPTSLSYGSNAASALFYRQACLMERYTDLYEYHGSFSQYYPTYAAMSDHQLRGYFSWRTRVRAGQIDPAPLSFAFVYVYELLMGVGTTPGEQGLADLRAFGQAYQEADEAQGVKLNNYLRLWTADYAVYHHIPDAYGRTRSAGELDTAVVTLLQAEHAQLREEGRSPRIPHAAAQGASPSDEQLYQALGSAASYHICESRLAKEEPQLVRAVALDVFRSLVSHCSKRRKTDYVEGLFGYASRTPYTMFSAAVFYESAPHPDDVVTISEAESFECRDGRWWHLLACDARARNAELGLAMHTVDFELRERLSYAYPLKGRETPKYLQKIVQDAVNARLEERAEAERRRISIDLTKLSGIRAAAAMTQEALLTDEEREEQPTLSREPKTMVDDLRPAQAVTSVEGDAARPDEPKGQEPSAPVAGDVTQGAEAASAPLADPSPLASPSGGNGLLTDAEAQFVIGLLEGRPTAELVKALEQFPSVVVDSINEKLFDLIGDAVIEFDGDDPRLVEDYVEDVREVLQP